jgi:hypothetical protein
MSVYAVSGALFDTLIVAGAGAWRPTGLRIGRSVCVYGHRDDVSCFAISPQCLAYTKHASFARSAGLLLKLVISWVLS